MRRLVFLFALVVSCNLVSAQIKVACIGNSITFGLGYDNPKSYPAQLDSMLGKAWEVRNFGVPGATILRNGDVAYHRLRAFSDAKSYNPDVVIIKLGTNDSKPQNWKYADSFISDYDSLIMELKALPSRPMIYLSTPVPAYSAGWGIRDSVIRTQLPLVDSVARKHSIQVIDLYGPLSAHPNWFPDGIHPNEFGLGAIARMIGIRLVKDERKIIKRKK